MRIGPWGVLRCKQSSSIDVSCAGGALGGFVNALAEPIFEFFRIAGTDGWVTRMEDPDAADAAAYASHRVIWGGIWGLLFIIPLHKSVGNFWLRSVVFGALRCGCRAHATLSSGVA